MFYPEIDVNNNVIRFWYKQPFESEEDKIIVEKEVKEKLDHIVHIVAGDRKYRDGKVFVAVEWNALQKVQGPFMEEYVDSHYYSMFLRYHRNIEFI
jgi:hypothetical protein